jgi:hypothetical protein
MALMRSRRGAVIRRITFWSLGVDVAVALIVGLLISSIVGWILFIIGLVLTSLLFFNAWQVSRIRR